MYQSVDVAAISFRPKKFDLADNADRLEAMFRAAAKGGAQLALAPEGVLEGYVVMELITGEEPEERMRDVAVTTRGPVIGRFRELARELGICLAFGLAERIGEDVYNCAVFIDHRGRLCGKYPQNAVGRGLPSLLVVQPPRCPCPRL